MVEAVTAALTSKVHQGVQVVREPCRQRNRGFFKGCFTGTQGKPWHAWWFVCRCSVEDQQREEDPAGQWPRSRS